MELRRMDDKVDLGRIYMSELYKKLQEYSISGIYPFHMPGHKRNKEYMPNWNLWQIDMTEVEGTDNLHHAEGILKEAMGRAANLWGADSSYFLVNGSTGGILSAIAAITKPGDMVLVARNCHKSVYHALFLNQLQPIYIYPEWIAEYGVAGGISPSKVAALLEKYPQIRAVIVTSPTYEGIVSDIGQIAKIVHQKEIPLFVDEAHGAHFYYSGFPVSAIKKGADLVVQSCHKTLPALTQTGLLHLKGAFVEKGKLEEFLSIYQTSSPSYILMASIDNAIDFLREGQAEIQAYREKLLSIREELAQLSCIVIPGKELVGKYAVYDVDISKLILSVCGKVENGKWLYQKLKCEYGLQCEMAMEGYALAITSVMDTEEGWQRLVYALKEIDGTLKGMALGKEHIVLENKELASRGLIEPSLTITEAFYAEKISVPWEEAAGRISAEYIYLYPPGIPLLVPGEMITEAFICKADTLVQCGFELQGQRKKGEILVVC